VSAAAVTSVLIASAAIVPAAWALNPIPPGGGGMGQPPAGAAVTAGGMPGWQIALIALIAALVAAIAAVLLDRARAARRAAPSS
jgi:hypothetical protein